MQFCWLRHKIYRVVLFFLELYNHCAIITYFSCITTKGSVLNSMNFMVEDDHADPTTNDDKILMSAVNLGRNPNELVAHSSDTTAATQLLIREVVLLTTDRNLRVKALSQNVPVRELNDFIKWSGLAV